MPGESPLSQISRLRMFSGRGAFHDPKTIIGMSRSSASHMAMILSRASVESSFAIGFSLKR